MYQNHKIALVIPAYNEENLIASTLGKVPKCVDHIYVVDDHSKDRTVDIAEQCKKKDNRIEVISHPHNVGPGGGIISGYYASSTDGYDITVVVGADDQMPFDEIEKLLDPLVKGVADYTKGNRFYYWEKTKVKMPPIRIMGNIIITALTKVASGYYKVMDVVDGYTAITKNAIDTIDWNIAWKKYGYPMDFLIRLNAYGLRVKDVPRTPIYLDGVRQSQIKGLDYALKVSPMLVRGFFWRLFFKYGYLDFHPLLFFYVLGIIMFPFGVILGIHLLYLEFFSTGATGPMSILCALSIITGLQFLLFAMWFDMEASR